MKLSIFYLNLKIRNSKISSVNFVNCLYITYKKYLSGYTGDPFISCRQFTREDLCTPNPCGANAQCQPGFDNSGADRPVCTCLPGYRGDGVTGCVRGDCDNDSDCPDHQGCYDFRCEDPCRRDQCGANADCRARNHGNYYFSVVIVIH